MKPDGSLDAPFTLDDDDPPSYVPGPTVQRRHRQTLDQDGIEEISDAQQAAAAWKQVAARKQKTKQGNERNLSNDTTFDQGGSSSSATKDGKLANKAYERTPSAKMLETVNFSFDDADDVPVSGNIAQKGPSTGDKRPEVQPPQAPVPLSHTLHEAVLPERAKPAEPSESTEPVEPPKQKNYLFTLPMESLATPAYHSHFLPRSSVVQLPGPSGEPAEEIPAAPSYHSHELPLSPVAQLPRPSVRFSEVTQLNRSLAVVSAPRREPSIAAHGELGHNRHFNAPSCRVTSVLGTPRDTTTPISSHVVPPPVQSTRNVTDDPHKQTTPNRVATSSEREDPRPDSNINTMTLPLPTKTPSSNISAIPRPAQKTKAIKSVRRRNEGTSESRLSVRPPHRFSTDQQDVPNVFPKPLDAGLSDTRSESLFDTRRSGNKTPADDTSLVVDGEPVRAGNETIQIERSGERSTTPRQPTPLAHEETVPHNEMVTHEEMAPHKDPVLHKETENDVLVRAISSVPSLSRSATPTAQHPVQEPAEPTQAYEPPLSAPEATTPGMSTLATLGRIQNDDTQPEHLGVPIEGDSGQSSRRLILQADVLTTTRSAIGECLKRHVAERQELHAFLVETKMRHQRTFQEQELRARTRKQKRSQQSTLPKRYIQKTSPFENMPAIQVPFDINTKTKRLIDMSQEVFVQAKPKDTVIKSALAAPTTSYKSDAPNIPPFKEYVGLRNNVLADNESKLLATPYFQDEDYRGREVLLDTLPYMYEMTHDEMGPLDFRKEQCRFYKDAVEAFLSEIAITWNDILYWLLAQERDIKRINDSLDGSRQFEVQLLERSRYHVEEFERDGEPKKATLFNRKDRKWREFLTQLEEPIPSALRLAATACAAILQQCEFSIWYLAQQSEVVQSHIAKKIAHEQSAKPSKYKEIMCRVCHQHHCILHGEIRQVPEDSWKTDSEDEDRDTQATDETSRRGSDKKISRRISNYSGDDTDDEPEPEGGPLPAHFDDDSDIEQVTNYKLPANPDAFDPCPESEMISPKGAIPPPGKFNSNWWLNQDMTQHWEKRKPFFPCKHEGSCEDVKCRCFREGINCEKTCKCSLSCNRRYPGCSCSTASGKRVCLTLSCLCVKFNRECDADLCGPCGASKVLDPVNRYNDEVVQCNCCNVAIQRGVPRKTLLGHSEVHGFGLYMGEDIKNGEYIGEYTGEAISIQEGDRRVTIYDYQKTMYLFRLNSKQEVDATYMGNKLRFINNADDKYTNCGPKNLLCNTVFRIALFATRDIKAGTELFFNYNYPKEKTEQFKQPNAKVVAVKQTKQKTKKRESLTSLSQPIEDRSRILAATAKAREAKAAKRAAAMLQEGGVESAATRRRSGTLQARKAATSKPGRKKAWKSRRGGLSKNESTGSDTGVDAEASDPEIPPVIESQSTQTSLYVQDTEEEDEEFILPGTQVDEVGEDEVAGPDSDDEDMAGPSTRSRRGAGRQRKRESDVAPVVAVKQKKKNVKRGGARPGAGRKRKRPVVANSDDE